MDAVRIAVVMMITTAFVGCQHGKHQQGGPCDTCPPANVVVQPPKTTRVTLPPQKVVVNTPAPAPQAPAAPQPVQGMPQAPVYAPQLAAAPTPAYATTRQTVSPSRPRLTLGLDWVRVPLPVPRLFTVAGPQRVTTETEYAAPPQAVLPVMAPPVAALPVQSAPMPQYAIPQHVPPQAHPAPQYCPPQPECPSPSKGHVKRLPPTHACSVEEQQQAIQELQQRINRLHQAIQSQQQPQPR